MKYGNLTMGEDGIWFSGSRSEISYPASGNETCYQVEDHSFWFQHRNRCILECLQRFPPPGALFDIGGGNGFVSIAIQQAGHEAILVEPGIAGARNAQQRGLTNVICSTLEDARFQPQSLPAIGLFDVLEHIESDGPFLGQLHSVLQDDGRLYITVPAYRFLWSADDVFAGHARRYTRGSLIADIRRAGFEVEYASYFFSPLPLPIFVTRTLPTMLAIRSPQSSEGGAKQHLPAQDVTPGFQAILNWERRTIGAGGTIPFGSSCLLVARRRL